MFIVDTGPVLKFFATDNERVLFRALAHNPIHAPMSVRIEVFRVPQKKRQFDRAPKVWQKVQGRFIRELDDTPTPELEAAALDVFQIKLSTVQGQSSDLGEKMAILHASLRVQAGADVVLLCDDGPAQDLIDLEAARLSRCGAPGALSWADTIRILWWAIEVGAIVDHADLRKRYSRMASLDSSLPSDIRATGLLKSPPWPPK